MLPAPENYSVWPSVIPADTKVTMTVTANEKAFLFAHGAVYQLKIIHVSADEDSYYHPAKFDLLTVEARDGVLRFEHVPGRNGAPDHLSGTGRSSNDGRVLLYEDWYALTPYRGFSCAFLSLGRQARPRAGGTLPRAGV